MSDFELSRDAAGRLVLRNSAGETVVGVVPVRAFPITAPKEDISLLDEAGHEVRWIANLAEVPETSRRLLELELAQREFIPEIASIKKVSSFSTPSKWSVATNRGETELLLKAEDNIRRLSLATLLITDGHGVSYLIRDVDKMDAHSRKLLDRFL